MCGRMREEGDSRPCQLREKHQEGARGAGGWWGGVAWCAGGVGDQEGFGGKVAGVPHPGKVPKSTKKFCKGFARKVTCGGKEVGACMGRHQQCAPECSGADVGEEAMGLATLKRATARGLISPLRREGRAGRGWEARQRRWQHGGWRRQTLRCPGDDASFTPKLTFMAAKQLQVQKVRAKSWRSMLLSSAVVAMVLRRRREACAAAAQVGS